MNVDWDDVRAGYESVEVSKPVVDFNTSSKVIISLSRGVVSVIRDEVVRDFAKGGLASMHQPQWQACRERVVENRPNSLFVDLAETEDSPGIV